MSRRALLACLCTLFVSAGFAAELGVGSTRDEVIAQLGAPKSTTRAGAREIWGYPNGRVTLVEGRVASIDWKGALPSSAAPAPPAPRSVAPAAPASREVWFTDFAAAQAEAAGSKRRLLVLFTGSDWCPPCMEFEAKVAHAPEFLNLASTAFVLVKLDYPRSTPQAPAVQARNEKLRVNYGVNSYPSLLVISADGTKSALVDTRRSRPADNVVDFYVQAVDEARRAKEKSGFWPW